MKVSLQPVQLGKPLPLCDGGRIVGAQCYDPRTEVRLLPKDRWTLAMSDDGRRVCAGIYEYPPGYRYSVMIALADLPSDLISLDDLERFGIGRPSVGTLPISDL
jgi:hypothetical protein